LGFQVGAAGGDDVLVLGLEFSQLVEVGVRLGVGGVHLFELLLGFHHFTQAGFHFLADGLGRVELGLLGQVADGHVGLPLDLAVVFLLDAGHDLEHGGLARAVEAEQADLGAGEEGQGDVLDDLPLGGDDLAHAEHGHDVLGHGGRVPVMQKSKA